MSDPTCTCEEPNPSGTLNGGVEVCLTCGWEVRKGLRVSDLPMGGCSTSAAHYAHLAAGDPLCENQR